MSRTSKKKNHCTGKNILGKKKWFFNRFSKIFPTKRRRCSKKISGYLRTRLEYFFSLLIYYSYILKNVLKCLPREIIYPIAVVNFQGYRCKIISTFFWGRLWILTKIIFTILMAKKYWFGENICRVLLARNHF